MLMVIRQLAAILALPCTVAIVIPIWIARRSRVSFVLPHDLAGVALAGGGGALLLVGLALFMTSVFYFWSHGRGTLAPWDPPRRFVVEGPYRYVRNPMISGVIFLLTSEACILRSRPHAEWAALFTLINMLYIPLLEEPMLAVRFGEPYKRYTRAVSRFVPRFSPWSQDGASP